MNAEQSPLTLVTPEEFRLANVGLYVLSQPDRTPICETQTVYDPCSDTFKTGPAMLVGRVRADDGRQLPLGLPLAERRDGKQWLQQWAVI